MAQPDKKRRAILFFPERLLIDLFTSGKASHGVINVPVCDAMPDGASVVGVWHNYARRGFDVVMEHPSLAEVEEGVCYPEVHGNFSLVQRQVFLHPPLGNEDSELKNPFG